MVMNSMPDTRECDEAQVIETNQLLNNLFLNMFMAVVLLLVFEGSRNMKSIYMKRLTKDKFVKGGRVPAQPSSTLFGWLRALNEISEEDVLHMVGLDGYMMLRYIHICGRICAFISFWGLLVLVPYYGNSGGKECAWNRYTMGNVPQGDIEQDSLSKLWVPTIFAYVFSAFFCMVMYGEYYNFLEKRVRYLRLGDPDTPPQAYYTVMVEKVPTSLRSAQGLADFFDNLFPGEVYSIQLAADLSQLDSFVAERKKARDNLEKAIAYKEATGIRPTTWVDIDVAEAFQLHPLENSTNNWIGWGLDWLGLNNVDGIDYYTSLLHDLNESVLEKQKQFLKEETNVLLPQHKPGTRSDAIKLIKIDSQTRLLKVDNLKSGAMFDLARQKEAPINAQSLRLSEGGAKGSYGGIGSSTESELSRLSMQELIEANKREMQKDREVRIVESPSHGVEEGYSPKGDAFADEDDLELGAGDDALINDVEKSYLLDKATKRTLQSERVLISLASEGGGEGWKAPLTPLQEQQIRRTSENAQFMNALPAPAAGVLEESVKTVETAAKGAVRGVLEASRTLELLTVGAYYKTSSTAFVTLRSRVASSICDQMQLSHRHYTMTVRSAPNPRDIRWENVMIPQRQIDMRRTIADITLTIGALFWSLVLGFITQISSLEAMSKEYSWLKAYSGTLIYSIFNSYLTSGMLLALLSVLPVIFDVIARSYEGLKLESEIQNSIMTRYFYYQLANVFVSVYAGSIITALHQILDSPSSLMSILGSTLPSFSIYFANLVIVKTFTALPIEMLRLWPLAQIVSLKLCMNKKKCTWRELQTGAFADPPMLYGWIYPSLMMVLMIVTTYSCIAPLITPLGVIFYAFAYVVYKYQLLFVFINHYQAGGFMWYALFTRSMISLICGAVTLTCYLGFRRTAFYGPFYAALPLPFIILVFWFHCESKFKNSSYHLSLEGAIDLDRETYDKRMEGYPPHNSFKPKLFRQPSLAEGALRPGPYRPTVILAGGKSALRSTSKPKQSRDNLEHYGGPFGESTTVEDNTPPNLDGVAPTSFQGISGFMKNLRFDSAWRSKYEYEPIEESDSISTTPTTRSRATSAAESHEESEVRESMPHSVDEYAHSDGGLHRTSVDSRDVELGASGGSAVHNQKKPAGDHHDDNGFDEGHDFVSDEVNLAHDNASNIHMREVAGLLDFPISPQSVDVSRSRRRRNLTPPPRRTGNTKASQAQPGVPRSKSSDIGSSSSPLEASVAMEMVSSQLSTRDKER